MRRRFSVEQKEILPHMSPELDQMKRLRKLLLERPAFLWEIKDKESTRVRQQMLWGPTRSHTSWHVRTFSGLLVSVAFIVAFYSSCRCCCLLYRCLFFSCLLPPSPHFISTLAQQISMNGTLTGSSLFLRTDRFCLDVYALVFSFFKSFAENYTILALRLFIFYFFRNREKVEI